jgi:hypothetical protein
MEAIEFIKFMRKIYDDELPGRDVLTAINSSYSTLQFNPDQSRAKSKALQAARAARKDRHKGIISNDFFWSTIEPWASSDESSVIILQGSHSLRERIEDIAIQAVDQIETKDVSLAWIVNGVPISKDGEDPILYSAQDMAAQLCLQLLMQNIRLHRQSALKECLGKLEASVTESDWLNALPFFLEGLDEVYIVVDLHWLDRRNADPLSWPTSFLKLFKRMETNRSHSTIKVMFFTCRPITALSQDLSNILIEFPRRETRSTQQNSHIRHKSMNRNSGEGNDSHHWLQYVGNRKRKHTIEVSEDEDIVSGGDTMALGRPKK